MKTYFTIFMLLCSFYAKAQIEIDTAYFYQDPLTRVYYPKQEVHLSEITGNTLRVFKANQYYTFQKGTEAVVGEKKYLRYDQYKNGNRITGNSYFVTATMDDIILEIGGYVEVADMNIPSVIPPAAAISNLLNNLSFYQYKWDDSAWEDWIKEEKNDPNATFYPSTILTIKKVENLEDPGAPVVYSYTYPIDISAIASSGDSVYFDSIYYINAVNGNIEQRAGSDQYSFSPGNSRDYSNEMKEEPPGLYGDESTIPGTEQHNQNLHICSCSSPCEQGNTIIHYYGGQTVYSSEFLYLGACRYRLKHNCLGANIYVRKAQSTATFEDYRGTQTNWPNPADKVGTTAMWCITRVYDIMKNNYGKTSYDGGWAQVNLDIDDSQNGQTKWNKTHNLININFFKSTSSYQAVLDVIGHEYFHGILNYSSGLGNEDPPSTINNGNLQQVRVRADRMAFAEGFCDIMGQVVEFHTNNNYVTTGAINDFVHGGNRPGGFLNGETRSLINPPQTGNPKTLEGTNWQFLSASSTTSDFINAMHNNATVAGHWYYLLAMGGSGNSGSPNNLNYCVQGIGQAKAGQIAYLTSTHHLGLVMGIMNTNNVAMRIFEASISAVRSIYGFNSFEESQVVAAWRGIGFVHPAYVPGSITITNHTATGTENYNYNAVIETHTFTCTNTSLVTMTSAQEIKIGAPFDVNNGADFQAFITPACNGGAMVANPSGGDGLNALSGSNASRAEEMTKGMHPGDFAIMPNPSDGAFALILNNKLGFPESVTIIDMMGKTVADQKEISSYRLDFDLGDLSNGIYFIKVSYKDNSVVKRIVKNQ